MFLTRRDYTRAFYVTSFAASILLAAAPAKSADAPILSMRPAASATPSLSPAGRVLIGRGKDYTPVGANTDTEVLADQLSKSMKARRDFAWKVVEALLLPIKVQLPNGGAQVDVPLWQTWYDGVGPTNETKALFTLFFQKLKANPSADLATTADQALAEQATKDLSQSVTTENFTATLTQNVGATISTDLGGQGTTLFSPAFVKHMMVSARQVENCKQTGITPTTPPPSPTNFSQCINEFPREAVMIKTSWKDLAGGIAVHDTSGPAMSALMSEGTWPGANHPTKKPPLASPPPTSDQIYTNETANGRKFSLVGIHFVTKDVRDWVWISLWWSPDSSKDLAPTGRPAWPLSMAASGQTTRCASARLSTRPTRNHGRATPGRNRRWARRSRRFTTRSRHRSTEASSARSLRVSTTATSPRVHAVPGPPLTTRTPPGAPIRSSKFRRATAEPAVSAATNWCLPKARA